MGDPNSGLIWAAEVGCQELVTLFIERGADDLWGGIQGAVRGGHIALVDYFDQQGAHQRRVNPNDPTKSIGQQILEALARAAGAYSWNGHLPVAAQYGHIALIEYLISKGANTWNAAMCGAAYGGRMDLVEYFISKGANDWNVGMVGAAHGGHMNIVTYMIGKGANDWIRALREADLALDDRGKTTSAGHLASAQTLDTKMHSSDSKNHLHMLLFFLDRSISKVETGLCWVDDVTTVLKKLKKITGYGGISELDRCRYSGKLTTLERYRSVPSQLDS